MKTSALALVQMRALASDSSQSHPRQRVLPGVKQARQPDACLQQLHALCALLTPGADLSDAGWQQRMLSEQWWQSAITRLGDHFLLPAVADFLHDRIALESLPVGVWQLLDGMRALNRQRNQLLADQLAKVVAVLNQHGIEPLLLKGGVYLLQADYIGASDRVLGDLDLLIPHAQLETAQQLVCACGYVPAPDYAGLREYRYRHHHHVPLLHRELPVTIELHREPVAARYHSIINADSMRQTASSVRWRQTDVLIPALHERLLMLFIHSQLNNGAAVKRLLDLRALHEFAGLLSAAADIDWSLLNARLNQRQRRDLCVFAIAAADLFALASQPDMEIPAARKRYQQQLDAWCSPAIRRYYRLSGELQQLPWRLLPMRYRLFDRAWYQLKWCQWRCRSGAN